MNTNFAKWNPLFFYVGFVLGFYSVNALMSKKHRNHKKTRAQDHSGSNNPPTPLLSTEPNAHKDTSDAESKKETSQTLQQISRWIRFTRWLCKITVGEVAMIIVTLGIPYANARYTHYAGRQWKVLERQVNDAEVFQAGRPKLEFSPEIFESGDFLKVDGEVKVKNIGMTELTNVGGLCDSWLSATLPETRKINPTDFSEKNTLYPNDPPRPICRIQQGNSFLASIQKSTFYFGINAAVSYRDIFGRLDVKKSCFMYYPKQKQFGPCPIQSTTGVNFP